MGTRLDRLVALVDGGSTPALRKQAASQLGGIAAQHGEESFRLLGRVAPLLRDKRQDARVAGSWAVEAVVANAPAWPPRSSGGPSASHSASSAMDIDQKSPVEVDNVKIEDDPLAYLSASSLLSQPHLLAASAASFIAAIGSAPSLKEQKAAVDKELGIEHSGVEVVGDTDLVDPNMPSQDAKAATAKAPAGAGPGMTIETKGPLKLKLKIGAQSAAAPAPAQQSPAVPDAAPQTPSEGLSYRQQLMAKKKAKMEVTKLGLPPPSAPGAPSPLPTPSTPIMALPPPLPSDPFDPSTCSTHPFLPLLEHFSSMLGHQRWESRHGACIGIRALLSKGTAYGWEFSSADGEVDFQHDPQNQSRHATFCAYLATDLLRLLSADRFADFGGSSAPSDPNATAGVTGTGISAPVREACAGALAALLAPKAGAAPASVARRVLSVLVGLLQASDDKDWHPKHAALLSLRYILAHSRPDLLSPEHADAILASLSDADDEVRGAAASAILGILRNEPTTLDFLGADMEKRLMRPLWSALSLADDLSGSTAPLLDLLALLLPKMPQPSRSADPLYHFLRHSSSQVRLATIRCIAALDPTPDALHAALLIQSLLLETNKAVLRATRACFPNKPGEWAADARLKNRWDLVMTPPGTPLDKSHFLAPTAIKKGQPTSASETVAMHDRPALNGDPSLDPHTVLLGRILAAEALGIMLACAPESHVPQLMRYLEGGLGYQRCVAGWAAESCFASGYHVLSEPDSMWDAVNAELGNNVLYSEQIGWLGPLRRVCMSAAVPAANLAVPPLPTGAGGEFFDEQWVRSVLLPALDAKRGTTAADAARAQVDGALAKYQADAEGLATRVHASLASALVASGKLPDKVTPLVRSIINAVKIEVEEELQQRAAKAAAKLVSLVKPEAAGRMVKNLGAFLCEDTVGCPKFGSEQGIVTLARWTRDGAEDARKANRGRQTEEAPAKEFKEPPAKKSKRSKSPTPSTSIDVVDPFLASLAEPEEELQASRNAVASRGGEFALAEICRMFGADVFEKMPKVWELISAGLSEFVDEGAARTGLARLEQDPGYAQTVVGSIFSLGKLVGCLQGTALDQALSLMPAVSNLLVSSSAVVRFVCAGCFASFADNATIPTLHHVIARVLPLLGDTTSTVSRQAGAEAVYQIVERLQLKVLPYLIFLVIPVLKRISDPEPSVRFLCTHNFATLVKLMPLEQGAADPEGLDPELVKQKKEERRFIGQLIGTEQVDDYEIPDGIVKAELRRYQQEGVNWLAFLARYGMHGILCDDMGLGKTLQTISIVASNHYLRAKQFRATGAPDAKPIPTLVVCPTTIVGHWYYEIKNFAPDVLKPIMYVGNPTARAKIRPTLASHDVVITSYDVVRNDLAELGKITWNYIVLDEGHLIRNSKTKLTQAVKALVSTHRLILSGTPIQNNALELWSLFDFLMPGFLGTEKQFNERYSKPILSSKDAKASTREQEAGTLALDALHRQVLPFILRRMKEDVLNDLPPKIIQDYYSELGDIQRMLYEDFARSRAKGEAVQDVEAGEDGGSKKGAGGSHIFQALQYLRKLVNHPALVVSPQHPEYYKVQQVLDQTRTNLRDLQHAPKLLALKELLQDCGIGAEGSGSGRSASPAPGATEDFSTAVSSHRALIFCQLKPMLDIIENDLFKTHMPGVTYMRLDGSVEATKRQELVRKFNDDPSIDVLLLTTHVGGLGLNLTGADTVIFVEHDWNPMKDLQAMDRAHRIGQKRKVNVYRLITRNTLEEKIMGLQRFKLNIANSIVNEENVGLKSMLGDSEQMLDLFSISEPKAAKDGGKKDGDKRMSQKEILDGMDAWEKEQEAEEQYETTDFLSKLR